MIYYGFLAALVAAALAGPSLPNIGKSTLTEDRPVTMSEVCFFGSPTIYCTVKCRELQQKAYCEERKCLCRLDHTENPQDQKHHETQQDASVPTPAPAYTTTVPEHTVDATIAAKPTEEEPPMKCFFGFRPIACERRCDERGLKAHCKDPMDGELCVCVPHMDIQPQQNMEVIRLPFSEGRHGPNAMCSLGVPKMPCYVKCMTEDGQPTCDELQNCVCQNPDNVFSDSRTVNVDDLLEDRPDEDVKVNISPNIIMSLLKLFGNENKAETIEVTTEATTSLPYLPPNDFYYDDEDDSWNYEYLLVFLVLALLSVLVLLELLSCYKRKKSKSNVDTIFKTMPTTIPDKS